MHTTVENSNAYRDACIDGFSNSFISNLLSTNIENGATFSDYYHDYGKIKAIGLYNKEIHLNVTDGLLREIIPEDAITITV
jgi:hypothetical protein